MIAKNLQEIGPGSGTFHWIRAYTGYLKTYRRLNFVLIHYTENLQENDFGSYT